MSALANFSSAPISTSGFTAIPPIIPPHQQHFRYNNNDNNNMGPYDNDDHSLLRGPTRGTPLPPGRQNERQQRVSRLLFLREERDKRRRSVNIPAYHKPKEARLISAVRHRCVEVQGNGSVRTTQLNSLFAVFEVTFWCHVFPFFKSCSSGLEKASLGNATFSTVLFRYKESNRYLCIDKRGKVFSRPVPDAMNNNVNLEECVFQSAYLLNQYDVYYSRHYPTHTDKCRTGLTSGHHAQKREKRTCSNRWYLGVDRRGRVRTVKTGETKIKPNTFFITRWVNEQKGQFLPGYHSGGGISRPPSPSSSSPSAGTAGTQSEGLFEIKPPRKPKSVFSMLFGHKRNSYPHKTAADDETEVEYADRKSQCANLLRNCNPEVDLRRANHAASLRRRLTPEQKRKRELTDRSQR